MNLSTTQLRITFRIILSVFLLIMAGVTSANDSESQAVPAPIKVTALNYVKVKTAIQFDKYLALTGGKMNTFLHRRNLVGVNVKSSKRLNRDTLYSFAIVDISKGATLTIPDVGGRYVSAQIVNEDGFTNRVFYGSGTFELSVEEFDTPFVWVLIRTLVSEAISGDIKAANKLQDQMSIRSKSSKAYVHPAYDVPSFEATTKLLLELGTGINSNVGAAGKKGEVDSVMQLLASAYGFGTLPETESYLVNVEPGLPANGTFVMTVKDVPVDGFWSVTVYNKDGYFNENPFNRYSVNDRTAVRNADGSITIQFGGDTTKENALPISAGWNYVVRLYRPRQEILNGEWQFPDIVKLSP